MSQCGCLFNMVLNRGRTPHCWWSKFSTILWAKNIYSYWNILNVKRNTNWQFFYQIVHWRNSPLKLNKWTLVFFKRLKWNILSTQKVLLSTRCAKEKQKNLYNIYKVGKEKTTKRNTKEITLSVAQHCEGTKPPTMIIERDLNNFSFNHE